MEKPHCYNLTVAAVAAHYNLTPRTVRARLKVGDLASARVGGEWRCCWRDVWSAEQGPMPRGQRAEDYKQSLLTKKELAALWAVSERTVERWIEAGLPTRNVFGSVRIAPVDAEQWTAMTFRCSRAAT